MNASVVFQIERATVVAGPARGQRRRSVGRHHHHAGVLPGVNVIELFTVVFYEFV
jgi:hypothetical protein